MATDEEKRGGKGFTVQDRRRFTADGGEVRETTSEADSKTPKEENKDEGTGDAKAQSAQEALPEISFSTFIIGLSTQALMHLGEITSPVSEKLEIDIPAAKQMIDILGMLQDKTRGNLAAGEQSLIEDILFDLRMKYVEAVKRK
jgi:hypothetical protein